MLFYSMHQLFARQFNEKLRVTHVVFTFVTKHEPHLNIHTTPTKSDIRGMQLFMSADNKADINHCITALLV